MDKVNLAWTHGGRRDTGIMGQGDHSGTVCENGENMDSPASGTSRNEILLINHLVKRMLLQLEWTKTGSSDFQSSREHDAWITLHYLSLLFSDL